MTLFADKPRLAAVRQRGCKRISREQRREGVRTVVQRFVVKRRKLTRRRRSGELARAMRRCWIVMRCSRLSFPQILFSLKSFSVLVLFLVLSKFDSRERGTRKKTRTILAKGRTAENARSIPARKSPDAPSCDFRRFTTNRCTTVRTLRGVLHAKSFACRAGRTAARRGLSANNASRQVERLAHAGASGGK